MITCQVTLTKGEIDVILHALNNIDQTKVVRGIKYDLEKAKLILKSFKVD